MKEQTLIQGFVSPITGTRLVWNSAASEKVWAPRLNQIQHAWHETERHSVLQGVRKAAKQPLRVGLEYERVVAWARNNGLFVMPLLEVGMFAGFAHSYPPGKEMLVVAIAKKKEYFEDIDSFLNYPHCCVRRFEQVFKQGFVDPAWQFATDLDETITRTEAQTETYSVNIQPHPFSNPLLRYYNIRYVPHIPCSWQCKSAYRLGESMRQVMKPEIRAYVDELLSGAIRYDQYRGVAEIHTKHFRLITVTHATPARYIINSGVTQQFVQLEKQLLN